MADSPFFALYKMSKGAYKLVFLLDHGRADAVEVHISQNPN